MIKNRFTVFATALFLLFQACQSDEQRESASPAVTGEGIIPEQAFISKRPSTYKTGYLFGESEVTYAEIDNNKVFEGDLILNDQITHEPVSASGRSGRYSYRWPNNTVYYTISASLPQQSRVTNAIAHWENNSTLDFVLRTNQTNYIEFVPGSGCYSNSVGMKGGRQEIGLASGCSTGNAIHEIGHAIGLFHEHTGKDRDAYVTINYGNIIPGYESQFDKYTSLGYSGFDYNYYNIGVDFGSIMMYPSDAFTVNGAPTIVKKDGSTFSAQRNALSNADSQTAARMYPPLGFPQQLIIQPSGSIYAFYWIEWNNTLLQVSTVNLDIFDSNNNLIWSLHNTPNDGFHADNNVNVQLFQTYTLRVTSSENASINATSTFTYNQD